MVRGRDVPLGDPRLNSVLLSFISQQFEIRDFRAL